MESQLQNLIEKIKTDGVDEAKKQADTIVTEAQSQAQTIISDAKKQASQIIEDAKSEAARTEEAGTKALEQAGRNLILSLKKEISDLLDLVLKNEVKATLSGKPMLDILNKIAENWNEEKSGSGLEIILSKEDCDTLTSGAIADLQKKITSGVKLTPSDSVEAGFRIGQKDGNVFYDFTEEGIAEIMGQYLNPKLSAILNNQKGA